MLVTGSQGGKQRGPWPRTDEERASPGQDEVMTHAMRQAGAPSSGKGTGQRWSQDRDAGVPEGPGHEWEVGVQGECRWQRLLIP